MAWYCPQTMYLFTEEQAPDDYRGIDFGCDRPAQEPRGQTEEIISAVYDKIRAWLTGLNAEKKEALFKYLYEDGMSSHSPLHPEMEEFLRTELDGIVRGEYAIRGLEKGAIFAWPIGAQMSNLIPGKSFV